MRQGTYVTYDSAIYGKGSGQVIDIIEKDNKTLLLCERLLGKRDYKDGERKETVIALELKDVRVSTEGGLDKRMRYR